jgi:hypothetical protein
MSQKSRRRNKKILAAIGIGLGAAAMASKKRNASIADNEANESGFAASTKKPSIADVSGPVKKKDTAVKPIAKPESKATGSNVRTRGKIVDSSGDTVASAGTAIADNKSKVTDVTRPGENMYSTSAGTSNPRAPRARGGRAGYKHGGSTGSSKSYGAAKRGISPILMKGRK